MSDKAEWGKQYVRGYEEGHRVARETAEVQLRSLRKYAQHKQSCGLLPRNYAKFCNSTDWQPTCTCGLESLDA